MPGVGIAGFPGIPTETGGGNVKLEGELVKGISRLYSDRRLAIFTRGTNAQATAKQL